MINGEITVRVAPNAIDAETQFTRPVFQTLYFDQKSSHVAPETDPTLRAEALKVQKKVHSAFRPHPCSGKIFLPRMDTDLPDKTILRELRELSPIDLNSRQFVKFASKHP
jgi:hypothetical protein